jgi:hypothetical protein
MASPIVTERGPSSDKGYTTKARNDAEFLAQCVKRFNRAEAKESDNRMKAVDDLRFKNGDQWDPADKASRTIDKRPCLTINKMKTFVHQITNDQRQNRPQINVSPVGDKGDPETAKMLKGLIRQIERMSNADVAYDTGFDSAVSNGWGYWRILTDYEDEDTFDQVIKITRIRNPFRVYLDPDHEEPDGSDAKWGFISDLITREQFEEDWPHADPMAWSEGGVGDEYKLWNTQTHVRIAEYFYEETETRTLVHLSNGHVGFKDELDDSLADEEPLEERDVSVKRIKWCKITAHDILEENDWLGKWMPIVKCIGDEVDIEGKVMLAGLIRDAKDAQRMYNYWVTMETELIALAPKAPWIVAEGQIENYTEQWKTANTKSNPFLQYNPVSLGGHPVPPPQRQQFAGPPAGVVQAKISAAQDMQATTGIRFDATLQERTYDESGKALRELKRTGDLGNFHYVDNLSRSLRHTGRILIDLIPKIYDTPRVLTILREDGSEERVKIDPSMGKAHAQQQLPDGRIQRLYNPKLGDYDVAVTVGPSYATKRAEAADSMLQFMRFVPQSAPIIGDLIAKNMDWPGAEEIQARMASMLPPHLQMKNLDQLPPEARGLVGSMMQQMQQLKQEHDKAIALLGDKEKDRQIDREANANERAKIQATYENDRKEIELNFEAKLTKVAADLEGKLLAAQAKPQNSEADQAVAIEKIARDFEAKVLKIVADMEVARMKNEQQMETAKMQDKTERSGIRRKDDLDKITETVSALTKHVKELESRADDEIVFERNAKGRIEKAKRVKRAVH